MLCYVWCHTNLMPSYSSKALPLEPAVGQRLSFSYRSYEELTLTIYVHTDVSFIGKNIVIRPTNGISYEIVLKFGFFHLPLVKLFSTLFLMSSLKNVAKRNEGGAKQNNKCYKWLLLNTTNTLTLIRHKFEMNELICWMEWKMIRTLKWFRERMYLVRWSYIPF